MTTTTAPVSTIGTAHRTSKTEAMLAFSRGATILVSKTDRDTLPVTRLTVRHTSRTVEWDELVAMEGDGPVYWYVARMDSDGQLDGCRCVHPTSVHGRDGCGYVAYGPRVAAHCSCSARPPAACVARADLVRTRWESSAPDHQRAYSTMQQSIEWLADRLGWNAPAAGEYPGPTLTDAATLANLRPAYADQVWHHAAGATILGGYCCGTPADHRDALIQIARELRAEERIR